MAKFSLAGWKDPVRRPRYIIWTGVAVLMLAAVMIVALGVTSTRWFCSEGCHKVQDDTIIAYQHSTHSEISCMACHMPVNANPVAFMLHKVEALLELYMTVTNKYELPLNPHSHVSLVMKATQCTQCHNLKNRKITPSAGIIIDHEAHEAKEVNCTLCHNRIAHIEDFELTKKNPNGEESHKHEDFMKMTACFRCHSLEKGAEAPGACSACHTKDFELRPDSHKEKDFYPAKHGELAAEYKAEVEKAKAEKGAEGPAEGAEGAEGEGAEEEAAPESEEGTATEEKKEGSQLLGTEKAYASEGGGEEPIGLKIPTVGEVFYCGTCHLEKTFCTNCHGMDMPHNDVFKTKEHPEVAKAKYDKCVLCHAPAKTYFCEKCHHGEKSGWEYDVKVKWQTQHAKAVVAKGVTGCLGECHKEQFCLDCHTRLKPVPSSHKARTWLHKSITVTKIGTSAAQPTADHAVSATKSNFKACEICHGTGGANAKFCKSCHKLEMPHPTTFKEFHAKTGRSNPKVCTNCHKIRELCSDCHHAGATAKSTWQKAHGPQVGKSGAASCLEKCHKDADCVKCHTSKKVVPASHKASRWTKDFSKNQALHAATYTKAGDSCGYCHGKDDPTKNKFCKSCHKLSMPHPDAFGAEGKGNGGEHQELFKAKKVSKTVCANCHQVAFCNSCHHKGASPKISWQKFHQQIVKKSGAEACFDCHKPTFCSFCHVRLIKR